MDIQVAVKASREFIENLLLMGRSVAFLTLRNVLVLGVVAVGTVDLAMQTGGLLPGVEYLDVASSARNRRRGLLIGNLARLVDRMAFYAGTEILALVMGLMAVGAGRFIAMGSMALLAGKLAVFARELDQLVLCAGMAVAAGIGKPGSHTDFFRCVRV